MNRDFYNEIKNAKFNNITFGLYNKIDDDYIPKLLGKKYKCIYGIDDFEYYKIEFSKKEMFLITMYNKDFLTPLKELKENLEKQDCVVYIDYNIPEVIVVKLKDKNIE